MKLNVSARVISALQLYLVSHEDDIERGINDFGELKEAFYQLIGREAGSLKEVHEIVDNA